MYVTTDNANVPTEDGAKLYRTLDGGLTWTDITPDQSGTYSKYMVGSISLVQGFQDHFWVAYSNNVNTRFLYHSTDLGASWSLPIGNSTPDVSWEKCSFQVSAFNPQIIYFANAHATWSVDGGASYQSMTGSFHADLRQIRNYPANSGEIDEFAICGTDGGVMITVNGGQTWTSANGSGLGVRQLYGLSVNELSGAIITGAQDNYISIFHNGIWKQVSLAQDGGKTAASRTNKDILFGEGWCCNTGNINLRGYRFNGLNWNEGADRSPVKQLPRQRNIEVTTKNALLIAHNDLYGSTISDQLPLLDYPLASSQNPKWARLSNFNLNHGAAAWWEFADFSSAPSNPDRIYWAYNAPAQWNDATIPNGPTPSDPRVFFRTDLGGGMGSSDWVDLSLNLPLDVRDWLGINCLVVDPKDENRLWIGCGGFSVNNSLQPPYNGSNRVFLSEDGGLTWVDYSLGLPGFIVNDIVYDPSSNDGLYLATDIGVFYRNASMGLWECYSDGLPTTVISDLEIDKCTNELYVATFGRGVWKTALVADHSGEQVVDQSHTLSNTHFLATTLRVLPGNTLTITGTLRCYESAKIIVEQGARLVVDGGLITGHCGFWSGIEAWGTSTQHQYPASHPTYQALVELKNGAVIENARLGIQTMNPADWSMVGGVVKATDATFHNCHKGVSFVAYDNWNPNQPDATLPNHSRNNISRFTRCRFYVDDAYPGGDDFETHVSMWKVQGINFSSCTFENLQTASTVTPNTISESHKLGMGIYSLDAGFKVYSPCNAWIEPQHICNDPNAVPSEFRGLDHGIHALGGETGRTFSVTGARFENNIAGVYVNGVLGYSVVGNTFTLGDRDVTLTHSDELLWEQHHRGVYSTEAYGFAVDRNTFKQAGTQLTEGLVVGYSRDHNDVVFHNAASGLKRAYIGEGICADPTSSYAAIRGLWFLCNENNGNEYDLWSRKVTSADPNEQPDHTIRLNQGTSQRPADNTFDQVPGPTDESDFRVTTDATLNYWHRPSGTFVPSYVTTGKVNVWQPNLLPANNCAYKVLPWIPEPTPPGPTTFTTAPVFAHAQSSGQAYAATRYLFEQLLDGGDPDVLVQQIQQTWPSEAWDLRTELLANSPFLSTSTLQELVLKNVLPQAMLTEVMAANPDATRSDDFLTWLQSKSGYPLPAYLVDLVVASWDEQTYRSTMEAEMALHHGGLTQATNSLIQHYRHDSVAPALDSLVLGWRLLRTPAARYAEALTWLERDAADSALATLQVLAAEHYLTVDGNAELGRMQLLVEFIAEVHREGRNVAQLTGTEVDALEDLIGTAYDRPASWAQNILCFHYGLCRPPMTGGDEKSHRFTPHPQDQAGSTIPGPKLAVFPNPGSTFVAFDVDLQAAPVDAMLVVRDVVGREIQRFRLHRAQEQVIWDVRGSMPGSYTVSLLSGGALLRTEKFVLRP